MQPPGPRRSSGDFEIESLTPDLAAAFERFLDQPVKSDPGCAAKAAIADALYRIGAIESDVYLKGVRHVQMEPVWGGRADTATQLRGTCALALVRVHHPDFLVELGDLLADREAPVRRMAAQALAYSESAGAVPLLRLKALVGDDDPQVVGECLLALLRIAPRDSVEFAARFPRSFADGDRRGRGACPRSVAGCGSVRGACAMVGANLRPGTPSHRTPCRRHAEARRSDPIPARARRGGGTDPRPRRLAALSPSTATTTSCVRRSRPPWRGARTPRCAISSSTSSTSPPTLPSVAGQRDRDPLP